MLFLDNATALSSEMVTHRVYFQDTTKLIKKAKGKLNFIKKIFTKDDSAKLAKKFIHQHHKLLKRGKRPNFPLDVDTSQVKNTFFKTDKDFALDYEIFGWYPYWEKDYYKHINFSLLSTIAYFSYELDAKTGQAVSTHGWETTPLIDTIRTYSNKRILLTVSNFGEHDNRKFLNNPAAIETLINNLISLLDQRGADGVCIDFEGVQKKEKDAYTGFLLTLSSRLKKANKNYKIYMTIPAVNWSEALDFKQLNQAIDRFVIMGYDFYGKTSSVAGPVAPLKSGDDWAPYNLTTSVDYYLKNNIAGSKIILALPTYGSLWETENQSLQSKAKKFIGHRTYSYIKYNIEKNEAIYIDPISKSAYSSYRIKEDKTKYRQCWFENATSFTYKTQLIKDKKLKGLGIWALGYDKGYNNLWEVISQQLGDPKSFTTAANDSTDTSAADGSTSSSATQMPTVVSKVIETLGLKDPNSKINTVEKKLVSITNYKTILLYIMGFILFFGCIGFIGAMIAPNTRASFFNDVALKSYYTATLLLIAVVIFRMQHWIEDAQVLLIFGFILGVIAYHIATKIIEKKKKDLP